MFKHSVSKHSRSKHSRSKRIALFSAAAFGALALTAAVVAPVSAQDKMMKSELSGEKTVMVGGAAMFPSKNIVQNAVNSKDHTTLVAAVKAAGLVNTLESKGPFTVFAPTNAAFGKLPAGTVDNLVKPENKATLSKILTYHVVAGKLEASDLTEGKKLKTVEGEQLTIKKSDGKVMIIDSKGNSSTVTIPNVNQSNGVIHVVDTVLMPS
ncbi:MAG: fasciclin domain-containing protein [Bradyrhizobium sp.]